MIRFTQCLALLVMLVIQLQAKAGGFITFDESTIESIFAQNNSTFIDFRLTPTVTITSDSLLSIDSLNEINALYSLSNALNTNSTFAISLFYLDAITFCGTGSSGTIAGCAAIVQPPPEPGSFAFLNSSLVADPSFGTNVIAHELSHTITGVNGHVAGTNTNLMNAVAYNASGIPPLTTEQQTAILSSPYVQADTNGRFVEVTPFTVLAASPVPEPASYAMLAIGLIMIRYQKRRSSST